MGYIDSIETMGLVDGPGIRFVTFMSGCKLRCLFCHNPETWDTKNAYKITSEELIKKIHKYKSYYKNGGVTFSGGEPLLQPDFLIETLKKCKMINLHTALDTAGVGIGKYEEILKYTDLVILDIKALYDESYYKMTGSTMDEFNKFLEVVQKLDKKLWIRQVIIPGINDTEEYIISLNNYLKKIKNIEKVELLAYHTLGTLKYKKLNLQYPLEGTKDMSKDKLEELKRLLN
ncbi:MAG: pyruvate formate-lyase-activating protein [Bacilli bacterium]